MHSELTRNGAGRWASEIPLSVCCERGCENETAAWSRVRCVEHYADPAFDGHAPFAREVWSHYPCTWAGCTHSRPGPNHRYCSTHKTQAQRLARQRANARHYRRRTAVSDDQQTA